MARKSQRLRRQKRIERLKAREQEAKLTKTIEDNSLILERMKAMSNSIDEVCDTLDITPTTTSTPAISSENVIEIKAEPPVEMKIQPFNEPTLLAPQTMPNFKKMTKRALLTYANENNISVKTSMTKNQLIKTIQGS